MGGNNDGYYMQLLQAAARYYGISLDKPVGDLDSEF